MVFCVVSPLFLPNAAKAPPSPARAQKKQPRKKSSDAKNLRRAAVLPRGGSLVRFFCQESNSVMYCSSTPSAEIVVISKK